MLIFGIAALIITSLAVGLGGLWTAKDPAKEAPPARQAQPTSPASKTHYDFSPRLANPSFFSPLHAFYPDPASSTPRDYSDPTAGGAVPLIMVEGMEDEFLSRHYKVEDFMARDGSPYARISPILVNSLEHVRWLADTPLYVSSGYRHPARNASPSVGGVARSQHLAGLAADVWSDEKSPGELAALALDVTECDIGIGLGRSFIHLDLRGYLASWVEEGAAMDEVTFDAWVRARCDALHAPLGSAPPSFDEAVKTAAKRAKEATAEQEDALIRQYHDVMAAFAEGQRRTKGQGAVLLDLRQDSTMQQAGLPYKLSYLLAESDEARTWNVDALIRSVQQDSYFAFVIIKKDGTTSIGATSFAAVWSKDG